MYKKWLGVLMLALLANFALCAQAAPDTPYDTSTLVLYNAQTEGVQEVVDLLYDAAVNFRTHVELPEGTRYQDVAEAISLLAGDFPELFYLENMHNVGYYTTVPDVANYVDLAYRMGEAAARSRYATLMWNAQFLVDVTAHMSAYDRALALHDALCARTVYTVRTGDPYIHEATGALVDGTAVCEGYAQAYTLLLRMSGIPCSMVSGVAHVGGQTIPHGWNILLLDGVPVQTDVTLDDQTYGAMHWYFGLSDKQMAADHEWTTVLPAGGQRVLEYHAVKGGLVTGDAQQRRQTVHAQMLQYAQTGKPVELRAQDAETFALLVSELSDHLQSYNRSAGQWTIDHELNIYGLESQLCVTLLP